MIGDPSILVSVDQGLFTPSGIYVYKGDSISIRGSSAVNVTQTTLSNVKIRSMDVNTADGSVYFFDITSRCIYRLHSRKVDNVHCGVSSSVFSSIAYDWIGGNIYWTDGFFNWIAVQPVSTTDKSMYRVIIQDDIEKPRAVAIDSKAGYMFWFDISPSGYRIERALLDGTVRVPIITTSLLSVEDIEIDAGERRLYWTDAGRDTIESSQYDGTDRKIIYRQLNINFRSIAVDTEDVCITIHGYRRWYCFSKATGRVVFSRSSEFLIAFPNIIAISKNELRPYITDSCPTLGCEHFCVNFQPDGKCMCKEGYTLDTDDRHCTEIHSLYHKGIVVSNATHICMLSVRTVTGHGDPLRCAGNAVQGCKHLAVDAGNTLIYYVDTTSNYIREYNLATHTIRQIIPVTTVSGIAFDWTDRNLYWSESTTGKLKYVTIATATAKELLHVTSPPSHLTIDPHTRTLFWVEGTSGYTMSIVSMSLVSKATSVVFDQPSPAFIKDIFFDVTSDMLYFVQSDKLYSTTRDGSDTHVHYSNRQSVDQLIIYKRYAIWSETTSSKVFTISLQQNDQQTTNLTINIGMISALAVYDEALQRPSNGPCFHMNGGCEQLCMTGISGSAVCACSYGLTLQTDGKSCSSVPQSSNFLLVPDFSHGKLFQISTTDAQITALDIDIVEKPVHAVYDPKTSFVFWSDIDDDSIMKSTLSGRNVDIIFTAKGIDSYPTALAMDNSTGNLYYTVSGEADTISPGSVGVLQPSSGLVRTLVDNLNFIYGLALYPSKGKVVKMDLQAETEVSFMMDNAELGLILNLFVYPGQEDPGRSVCSSNNGGCSTFCLPKASISSSYCACQDGTDLKSDDPYTCVGVTRCPSAIYNGNFNDPCTRYVGDACTFQCNVGYISTVPSKSVTCEQNGQWNLNLQQLCQLQSTCSLGIPNGKFEDSCTRNLADTCTFICNVGYVSTVPSNTVTCGHNRQWNVHLQLLCQLKVTTPPSSTDTNHQMFIYIGAGLVGLIIVSVTIVAIVCVRKRSNRRGPQPPSNRSEPNVYYTPYQMGPNQGGMLAAGVVNQGMYNVGSQLDEKMKNLPSAPIPTPPYQARPEHTYDTIPANSDPAPPYEAPMVSRGPSPINKLILALS
ncbi:Low-density lipoprotein receptor-related protein 4 [Mizuhopecten yessoensis]|uniref:Low-density lipoprotein receptor-related protein 4 n=1 Tax=Mizuhopecten yessoensis TaxID=6573 RepID=A0A210PLW7_MIZYE|nr:Low-density lipoprotein receptor-related protein 4 [Mizuhopecten yessoensis]